MAEHAHHHGHAKTHDHDHSGVFHSHAPTGQMKKAFFLTFLILVVELIGGMLSHSLALLSDAGHVLTDIAAIGLSWFALKQSEKPPSGSMTFGYHRSGILAALINGITLILITLVILWEAYSRFHHPVNVTPTWMFISAGVGLLMNLYLGLGMRHDENINVRSAVLHMLGDAAASAAVILGGLIIAFTHWNLIDPILSVLIALLIAFGAWRIVKQTVSILMEGTPTGIEVGDIVETIRAVGGVHDVHDVHIWSITSGKNALSCHAVLDGGLTIRESQHILRDVEQALAHKNIGHVTVQIEDGDHPHDDSVLCRDDDSQPHSH
ncbi:cation diffusion facilitator family transporter [Ferroacidibacillus organovorans]|uniref:Cation diffusion facilitator family transporter n=1 Tax=Ferroacidibacillus organovorans TaxID=1765683 RepID=A0A853KAY6_9BACL|nr:cation diffusion facilitator family transporter [Ferroacidibacillus organovorans]KYP79790.1 cation diffusion facilitator family transporter [Ferroacidibacillus organovorans]OAG93631.1 cation diffusion facilitator family transporter [Ferroacidibacillus organovorans]